MLQEACIATFIKVINFRSYFFRSSSVFKIIIDGYKSMIENLILIINVVTHLNSACCSTIRDEGFCPDQPLQY